MQMMSGWLRHLELTFKSKTGFGTGVLAWGLIALLGAAATVVLLVVAGFVALAQQYGPLVAALALGGLFLLITIVAGVCCLSSQRQTAAAARLALAARSQAPWLDPRYLGVGIQIGRAIGWRRLVPLAAVGVLAAGLAKEWIGRSRPAGEAD
jgi:hypothetical protein